jgi:hypothetical protein
MASPSGIFNRLNDLIIEAFVHKLELRDTVLIEKRNSGLIDYGLFEIVNALRSAQRLATLKFHCVKKKGSN